MREPVKRRKTGLRKFYYFLSPFQKCILAKAEEEYKQVHVGTRENEKSGKYKDNSSLEAAFNEARKNEVTGTFGHLLR